MKYDIDGAKEFLWGMKEVDGELEVADGIDKVVALLDELGEIAFMYEKLCE